MMEQAVNLPNVVDLAVPFFIALVLMEIFVARFGGRGKYETRDAAASLIMGLGSTVSGLVFGVIGLTVYLAAYQVRLFDIGYQWWAFALCFVAEDLSYYVFHRTAHRVRWFWASHVIHHTSQHYNLSTALRQTWTDAFSIRFMFRVPLFLIGFPPAMVLFIAGINLVYQFWIHTEVIKKMGPVEWLFNTPSHHRVHHGTNPRYLDANYAGVFIIWDRMFGTFVEEVESDPVHYGITVNLGTFNPLKIATHEWVSLFRDLTTAKSWRERAGYFLGPPGWTPDGTRRTTDMIKAEWRAQSAPATSLNSGNA